VLALFIKVQLFYIMLLELIALHAQSAVVHQVLVFSFSISVFYEIT